MPLYEYKCPKCGKRFERLLSHKNRDEPQPCPSKECGEKNAKKQISQTHFSLKGGGWASDGYSG